MGDVWERRTIMKHTVDFKFGCACGCGSKRYKMKIEIPDDPNDVNKMNVEGGVIE
jgi:hypothetical protein